MALNLHMNKKAIHELFEEKVELVPEKIAVTFQRESLTYSELNRKANQLAHYLIQNGVKAGDVVLIYLNRSIDLIVSLLAVLKSGACYVPVHSGQPKKVLASIIQNKSSVYVISESSLKNLLEHETRKCFIIDEPSCDFARFPRENIFHRKNIPEKAYIIYTSGSTGTPKGVAVTHKSLLHTYFSWEKIYDLKEKVKSHLQMANFAFDVFSGDWIRALCSGGRLVLCPQRTLFDSKKLYTLISHEKIDFAEFVPVVLNKLLDFVEKNNHDFSSLKLLVCGSDRWSVSDFQRAQRICGPETKVINSYGATEATIDSTYFCGDSEVLKQLSPSSLTPIGRPFPHVDIYILDEFKNPVKNDNVGEIYIGGKGVAQGYFNQPSLTKSHFICNPFSKKENERMYRSGDLGYWLPDGNIALLGRNKMIVKINAQRVDLADIEASLTQHPKIKNAVVIPDFSKGRKIKLHSLLVLKEKNINKDMILFFLKEILPAYSIPHFFYEVEALALSENGKVDRKLSSQRVIREILKLPERDTELA